MEQVSKQEYVSHIEKYRRDMGVVDELKTTGTDSFSNGKLIAYSNYMGEYFIEKEYQLNNTTSDLITQIHNWIDNMIYKVDSYMPFNYDELNDMLTRVSQRGTYTEDERDVLNFLRNGYITNNKKQKQKT